MLSDRTPIVQSGAVSLLLAALGLLLLPAVASADLTTRNDRRLRLKQMPATEKAELLRKKERFERLPEQEQIRLRKLQMAIQANPRSTRLHQVMVRYHEWLKTLPSGQRTELLSLPAHARLEEIKRAVKQQERQQFNDLTSKRLLPADRAAILMWLNDLVARREEELLSLLPPDLQDRLRTMNKRDRLRSLIQARRRRGSERFILDIVRLTDEDVNRLASYLSEEVRRTLAEVHDDQNRQDLLRRWVAAALFSRSMPRATEDELRALYNKLPHAQKERLENLPHGRRMSELRRMYVKKRFEEGGRPNRQRRSNKPAQ